MFLFHVSSQERRHFVDTSLLALRYVPIAHSSSIQFNSVQLASLLDTANFSWGAQLSGLLKVSLFLVRCVVFALNFAPFCCL